MGNEVPYLAPGCFGSALMFKKDDMVCAVCPFAKRCEPAHEISLAAMRERFGIKPPAPRFRQKSTSRISDTEDPSRMTLPKKVRELLARLDGENLNIAEKIRCGENPFLGIKRYRFMMVAAHLIMRVDTPVTQKLIEIGLIRSMKWAESTARAHARMAILALEHVGAIENNDGVLSVKK